MTSGSSQLEEPVLPIISDHLWQDPAHRDFSLAQSLAAYLPLRVMEEGKRTSQAVTASWEPPQAPEWGVT